MTKNRVVPGCLLVVGVLFALVAGIVAVVLALMPIVAPVEARPFDRELWTNEPSDRRSMVADLLADELRVGATRREVLDLLGPPDERVRVPRMPNTTLVWHLGETRLVVEFDVEDRVTRAVED